PMPVVEQSSTFHLLTADTPAVAIRRLLIDALRWSAIDCALPPRRMNFVGRLQLFNDIRQFIRTTEHGYLVLAGEMGTGKTTMLEELVYRLREEDRLLTLYHRISYQSRTAEPENLAACLEAQLRQAFPFIRLTSEIREMSHAA